MSESSFTIRVFQEANEMFCLHPDGRVTKNPTVTWDECAVALFDALEREGTRRSVQGLQEENAKLRFAIERVLYALQDPDRETVEAALEAEWAHGRAEPDATRRTSTRAALIGVARHLRERLGL